MCAVLPAEFGFKISGRGMAGAQDCLAAFIFPDETHISKFRLSISAWFGLVWFGLVYLP